jgi:hypothetical protein
VRGGLDDALDKLARRDELRRRTAGEAPSTPPAVTELVEAIAGVVARHPNLNITVGVEGAGDPTLLHFAFADGVVQVSADHSVAARATESARHADFEIDVDEPVEEPPTPAYQPPAEPIRASRDDQDRFGPTDFEYPEPPTAERPYVAPPAENAYRPGDYATPPQGQPIYGAASQETGAHPFAATPPPPVPPQNAHPYAAAQSPYSVPPQPSYNERPVPPPASAPPASAPPASAPPYPAPHAEPQAAYAESQAAFAEPQAAYTEPQAGYAEPHAAYAEPQAGYPEPLAQPIPLQVERPEETELAARRLAAMLRDNPTLLDNPHH